MHCLEKPPHCHLLLCLDTGSSTERIIIKSLSLYQDRSTNLIHLGTTVGQTEKRVSKSIRHIVMTLSFQFFYSLPDDDHVIFIFDALLVIHNVL